MLTWSFVLQKCSLGHWWDLRQKVGVAILGLQQKYYLKCKYEPVLRVDHPLFTVVIT